MKPYASGVEYILHKPLSITHLLKTTQQMINGLEGYSTGISCIVCKADINKGEVTKSGHMGDNTLNKWMSGKFKKYDIAKLLSSSANVNAERIIKIMEDNCRNLLVFQEVFSWAKMISKKKKTAIVTVNADIFSDTIVEFYSLDKIFSVIVNSCQYQTLDKRTLCYEALNQLGGIKVENSLLIDNTPKCCEDYKDIGGSAYLFQNEEQFNRDFSCS